MSQEACASHATAMHGRNSVTRNYNNRLDNGDNATAGGPKFLMLPGNVSRFVHLTEINGSHLLPSSRPLLLDRPYPKSSTSCENPTTACPSTGQRPIPFCMALPAAWSGCFRLWSCHAPLWRMQTRLQMRARYRTRKRRVSVEPCASPRT